MAGATLDLGRCDICDSSSSTEAGSYTMAVSGHPLDGTSWHLRRCSDCGTVRVDPRPGEQLFGGFIPDAERDMAGRKRWTQRLERIERFRERGKLLDVGAGAGGFLAAARERGWHVNGLDVQESFARDVQERLGIHIHVGQLSDHEIQSERFDAVTMWDVIEHVPSARQTLSLAAAALRPGGVLAISTINAGSANARFFGPRWVFWNRPGRVPEHLRAFTPYSLRRALLGAGLTPTLSRTRFTAGAIIEPLVERARAGRGNAAGWQRYRRSPIGRIAAFALWRAVDLLGRPLDLLHLGDILEMYAVKETGQTG